MNLALFYDTETTGLPLWRDPSDLPQQPHIVQLAASLVDVDTRKVLQSMDMIVRPDGWTIPQDTIDVHGITNELAMDVGISEEAVVSTFLDLWAGRTRIGHNEPFDARIIRIAFKRMNFSDPFSDKWKTGESECTCKMATPIVKCPPSEKMKARNMKGPKKANLQEAYEHFFGEKFEDAHSALADVNACMSIYFAMKDLN